MNNKERRILIVLVIACFMGLGLFACYSRWVMEDEGPRSLPYMRSSASYSAPQPTVRSSVYTLSREEAGYAPYSASKSVASFSSASSPSAPLHLSGNAQTHSYGGGTNLSASTQMSASRTAPQQSAPLLAMVTTTGSARFTTSASNLSGGSTTMSDVNPTPTIRRASDPGDIEEEPMPIGDMPWLLMLLLSSLYIGARVFRARKQLANK